MSEEVDLFGESHAPEKKRTTPIPNGYAWTPGSGPDEKRCWDCVYAFKVCAAGTYHKCKLTKDKHTRGRATDILLRSPACKFFKQEGLD